MSHHGGSRAAGAQRVVIEDDVDAVTVRQRVVAGLGLGVDERDGVELGGIDALDRGQRHLQVLDHRPVLRAADDAAVGERRDDAELVLREPLQPQRRRERVGIGVVVRVDQEGTPPRQSGQRAIEIESRTRRFVHGLRSGGGSNGEVVERQLGFPVVDRQIFMARAGQRLRVCPGEERAAVDRPVDRAALPGDLEVIAAVWVRRECRAAALRPAPCSSCRQITDRELLQPPKIRT